MKTSLTPAEKIAALIKMRETLQQRLTALQREINELEAKEGEE